MSCSMRVLLAAMAQILAVAVPQLRAQDRDRPASVPVVQGPAEDTALPWRFEQQWLVGGYADTLLGDVSPFTPARVDADNSATYMSFRINSQGWSYWRARTPP